MTENELLTAMFGRDNHGLREACAAWLATSRPFRAFLEENAGKVRKKARQARDAENLLDLQLELDIAYRLLTDRRVTLVYERYLAEKQRGPDLTVTFKGHIVFNVEARRLRGANVSAGKLGDVICDKLHQMPASAVNILVIGLDVSAAPDADCGLIAKRLLQRAEAKRDDFFIERGYRDARDFVRSLPRLSGIALRPNWRTEASPMALWLNPLARHLLPTEAHKLLQ